MSNQPPTDDELQQIRARAEAATPGPWVMVHGDDEYSMNLYCVAPKSIAHRVDTEEVIALDGVICGTLVQVPKTIGHNHNELNETVGPKWEENAEFIAHARTDIPALLDEVERLRKMVADLQDEKQDLEDEAISGVIERMSGNY